MIRSRLLRLTVAGATQFHVVARSRESGEQVEVLSGNVTAYKNYPSPYADPDRLGAGDVSMVNRSIDLMEKEHLSSAERHALSDAFR